MTIEEFREKLFCIGPGLPVVDRDTFPIVVDDAGIWTLDVEKSSKENGTQFLTHPTEEAARKYGGNHGYSQTLTCSHKNESGK